MQKIRFFEQPSLPPHQAMPATTLWHDRVGSRAVLNLSKDQERLGACKQLKGTQLWSGDARRPHLFHLASHKVCENVSPHTSYAERQDRSSHGQTDRRSILWREAHSSVSNGVCKPAAKFSAHCAPLLL